MFRLQMPSRLREVGAGWPSRRRAGAAHRPAFSVIDVETTGLDPACDRVVEVAVVQVDHTGRIVDEYGA